MRGFSEIRRTGLLGLALVALTLPTGAQEPKPKSTTEPVSRSNEEWWAKRHEGVVDQVKKGDAGLLFIGDSITQGWEGGGREVWAQHFEKFHPVNEGFSGDRTQHVLWRFDHGEIDNVHPKAAVIMIGTNNSGSDSAEDIADGITAIVQELRQKLPETKLLLLGVFPRSEKPDATREKLKQVNERISKLDDGKAVKFLDIGDKFVNPDGTISKEIMPDFLHLSPKGYEIWAEAIDPTLNSLIESK